MKIVEGASGHCFPLSCSSLANLASASPARFSPSRCFLILCREPFLDVITWCLHSNRLAMSTFTDDDYNPPSPAIRPPNRLPRYITDSEGEESNDGMPRPVETVNSDTQTLHSLLRAQIALKPDEKLVIYEEEVYVTDDENGDDDRPRINVVAVSNEEARRIGLEKFKPPSEEIINTKPMIRVKKYSHKKMKRVQKIKVPPSNIEETLNDRFKEVQNRNLKRNLNPFFATLNMLRHRQEGGFKGLRGNLGITARMLKKKAIKQQNGSNNTVMSQLAEAMKDSDGVPQDMENYWREQLEYWATQFKWFRDDNETHMSREELDKELEAYMTNRGFMAMDTQDELDRDIEEYMAKRGVKVEKLDVDQLNDDLDQYMTNGGVVDEQDDGQDDLDAELDAYMMSTQAKASSAPTGPSAALKARLGTKVSNGKQRAAVGTEDKSGDMDQLDNDLETYMARKRAANPTVEAMDIDF